MANIGGLSLAIMIVLTILSVFGRYFLRTDLIPGVYNIIERLLFPIVVFMAVPRAYTDRSFPKLQMVTTRLAPNKEKIVNIIILFVELATYSLITYYIIEYFYGALIAGQQIQISTVRWPFWPVMFLVVLSYIFLTLEFGRSLYHRIKDKKLPDDNGDDKDKADDDTEEMIEKKAGV